MRFSADMSRGRTRIRATVEAESLREAQKAAQKFAAFKNMNLTDVSRDYATVRIVDGEISFLTDVFDGHYERLPEKP